MALFATVTQEDIVRIDLPDAGFTERAQVPLDPVVSPLRDRIAREPASGIVHVYPDRELGLGLAIEINVVRSKRSICPSCHQRRVLYRLAAWSKGQAAGTGAALCAACAGFRA